MKFGVKISKERGKLFLLDEFDFNLVLSSQTIFQFGFGRDSHLLYTDFHCFVDLIMETGGFGKTSLVTGCGSLSSID